jgi:hypothetical protein
MTTEQHVPAALLERVRRDLQPVTPIPGPGRRALMLAPIAALLCVGVPALWGWRSNFSALGPASTWGLSAVQSLVALLIAALAFKEAVPGRMLSAGAAVVTAAAAGLVVLANTLIAQHVAPTVVPPGVWLRFLWECFGVAWLAGAPAVIALVWLASLTGPVRPAFAGGIAGLAAALMADSGTRLFCWVSSPGHVLVSHGGAILALALLGSALSTSIDRYLTRPSRDTHPRRDERPRTAPKGGGE